MEHPRSGFCIRQTNIQIIMLQEDPFSFRRLFQLSMSYGGVVLALLCYEPLQELFREPVTAERVRETASSIGALLPVGMAVAAVVAGMVRKVLFRFGGVNRRSLWAIYLLGTFWHLPLTVLVAHAAAPHEPTAWQLPLWFTGMGAVASLVLICAVWRLIPRKN